LTRPALREHVTERYRMSHNVAVATRASARGHLGAQFRLLATHVN
jgi:hypothetical protein